MPTEMKSTRIFNATQIAASASSTSEAIEISKACGLALHLTAITGTSPSVTFTYSLSPDGTSFTIPQSPVTIGATKSAVDVMDFAPEAAKYIKIIATNNNGSNPVTLTAFLSVQEQH